MALQTDYNDTQPVAVAGAPATMLNGPIISRNVEVAPIGFGIAVAQGATDKGCHAFGAGDTEVLGITLLDRSAAGTTVVDGQVTARTPDVFGIGESARIAAAGSGRDVWVVAAAAVAAGASVYVTTAGAFTSASGGGNVQIPGARWDTSTSDTGQLAVVRLA